MLNGKFISIGFGWLECIRWNVCCSMWGISVVLWIVIVILLIGLVIVLIFMVWKFFLCRWVCGVWLVMYRIGMELVEVE